MTRRRQQARDPGAERLLVFPHPVLEVRFGHGHPGNRQGAPVGARRDTDGLKPARLRLGIGPIPGQTHGAGGPDDGADQVAAGDLYIQPRVAEKPIHPLGGVLGGGPMGHGPRCAPLPQSLRAAGASAPRPRRLRSSVAICVNGRASPNNAGIDGTRHRMVVLAGIGWP